MVSSENKDTATQLEKRIKNSKEVRIVFVEPQVFNVVDEEGTVKYYGKLSDNKTEDECSCMSWFYGMRFDDASIENKNKGESRYCAENGHNFSCKHIIAARKIKYGEKFD